MFNLAEQDLEKLGAVHTATEIYQQPHVWGKMLTTLAEHKDTHQNFIKKLKETHAHVRVIFTGAGTSAFAGDTLTPELNQSTTKSTFTFESIATTDIVSNPYAYLKADVPTVLVSFARSGNSPESVAAVNLAETIIKDFYQVVITCNSEGKLAVNTKGDDKSLLILTPPEAHDKSFAMTSSFTTMMVAAYVLFGETNTQAVIDQSINQAERLLHMVGDKVDEVLEQSYERMVFLGSGLLGQLAHEGALKVLELTAGKVAATYESSLGFRHGPKSILNEQSLVVMFMSQDSYTRKYDMDLLNELATDNSGIKIAVVDYYEDEAVSGHADFVICLDIEKGKEVNDFSLSLPYIIFPQVLAMKNALKLVITPDNPSPSGLVNRVVQGVTIYPIN